MLPALSGMQLRRTASRASAEPFQPCVQRAAPPPSLGASAFLLLVACAGMQEGGTGCFMTGAADCSPSPVSEAAAKGLSGPGRRRTAPASQLASYRLYGAIDSSFSSQSLQPGDASSAQRREGHQPLRHSQASALMVAVNCCPGDSAAGLSFARRIGHSDHSWCTWETDSSVRCSLLGVIGNEVGEQGCGVEGMLAI